MDIRFKGDLVFKVMQVHLNDLEVILDELGLLILDKAYL